MDIIQNIIPLGKNNRPAYFMKPAYITVHDTANPNATAIAHGNYLAKNAIAEKLQTSWHFTVDDQNIVQHLPLNESGWHVGDGNGAGNRKSVGVEICEFTDGVKRHAAEMRAAKLVAYLADKLSIPVGRIMQHYDWTKKNCPRMVRARSGGWEGFIKMVESNMEKREAPEWKKSGLSWLENNGFVTRGIWKADDPLDMGTLGTILSQISIIGKREIT